MSEKIYSELVALGAPQLPDGYFYDITPASEPGKVNLWIVKNSLYGWHINGSLVHNIWIVRNRDRMMKKLARKARRSYKQVEYLLGVSKPVPDYIGKHP